ncbi:DNA cytosine methyltransferase [Amycolatopsis sp. NPDC048633]|uniref:DNA cytosine methyltransferase n=1 Tax=Amycolatopsis sp. NPDC048633 TaxID=3157095 RepID=UPI0033E0C918
MTTTVHTGAMTVLGLFSGIGGLELGLERAGMTTVGQVELDPFCRTVLQRHFPEVPRHDDVRTAVPWWHSQARPRVDVVAGGFPCQPVSNAGLMLGERDPRWLWPAMADVVADLRPSWVVWENVPGLRTRGLRTVLADLDRLGYRCRVGTLSACAVGAPHLRRRLFGVAHAHSLRCHRRPGNLRPHRGPELAHRSRWAVEPDVGRVAYGVPRGLDRRRALGNAVVPDAAERLGRLILATHHAALVPAAAA